MPTSVPMAATNTRNIASTPNRISAVADPRRQPRRASRLTPGSMASDRNTEMATRMKSPLSLPQKKRTAMAPRKPSQNTTTAGTTQRGMRRSSDGATSTSSVVNVAGSASERPRSARPHGPRRLAGRRDRRSAPAAGRRDAVDRGQVTLVTLRRLGQRRHGASVATGCASQAEASASTAGTPSRCSASASSPREVVATVSSSSQPAISRSSSTSGPATGAASTPGST